MNKRMTFYKKVDIASVQAGEAVYKRVSISIEDFNAACDHYGFVRERTCRIEKYDELPYRVCSACGAVQPEDYTVYYCWSCGSKVLEK